MAKQKIEHSAYIKGMLDIVNNVKAKKPRKKRAVETTPRNREEKILERRIILALKLIGCCVYKTGGSGAYDYNQNLNDDGIADLIVLKGEKGMFMEVKPETKRNTKDGGLTGKQPEFRDLCKKLNLKYVIVYSVAEALNLIR